MVSVLGIAVCDEGTTATGAVEISRVFFSFAAEMGGTMGLAAGITAETGVRAGGVGAGGTLVTRGAAAGA